MVEFNKNNAIKSKGYPSNCIIRNNNWWPIILITHYKYIFFINNRIWKTWAQKNNIFLYSKGQEKEIMVFQFIFPYKQLNLASFISKKRKKVI